MAEATITGIRHLKFPVSDLAASVAWYEKVFDFRVETEFPDEDGVVRGVAGTSSRLGGIGLALRQNPEAARGVAGFDLVSFGIADRAAAQAWAARLDELGVGHSPIIKATRGWAVSLRDPDGITIRLYSFAAD